MTRLSIFQRVCPSFKTLTFLLAVVVMSGLTTASAAQERTFSVTVSGEATLNATPDMATVSFGVVTHHDHPDRARALNAEAAANAMNAVRALGVEEKDIRLDALQLQPRREYDPDRRIYREDGFEATRSVRVIVRDLDVLPELMVQIVAEGANRVNNIQYGLDDRDAIELEVLAAAVARARVKASVMVQQLDMELGRAIEIVEQGVSVPQPTMRMEMAAMAKDVAEPDAFAAGELQVRATVRVVFALAE